MRRRRLATAQVRGGGESHRVGDFLDYRVVELPALPVQRHVEMGRGYPYERAVAQTGFGQAIREHSPPQARMNCGPETLRRRHEVLRSGDVATKQLAHQHVL